MGKGGKSNKGRKSSSAETTLRIPELGTLQEFCKVTKVLGGRRFELKHMDGRVTKAHLRGGIKKRKDTWVKLGTWVKISLREFEPMKTDIIEVLTDMQVDRLDAIGELDIGMGDNTDDGGGVKLSLHAEIPAEYDSDSENCAFAFDEI